LKKNGNSITSTDSSYGSFLVDWDIIQDEIGDFKISTNAYLKDAPSLNKYSTPLDQTISNQNISTVTFPDEKMVPVTYYDFHSDRTNPEFEQPFISDLRKGMVQNKLVNGVPATSSNVMNRMLNYYVAWWFQPSDTFSHVKIPIYTTTIEYKDANDQVGDNLDILDYSFDSSFTKTPTSSSKRYLDSAFSNVVIYDSLKFVHLGGGMYQFIKSPDFFPIDNRGFGNEWNRYYINHNFAFTMVLTHVFVKLPNQVFKFRGDDDVWAFVNDSLVMDLGGIHGAVSDSFSIDNLTSLKYNTVYTLKLFYCERHTAKSSINIESNMMEPIVTESKKRSWGRNYGNMN
jgi:fibro-slime domain-containing protein